MLTMQPAYELQLNTPGPAFLELCLSILLIITSGIAEMYTEYLLGAVENFDVRMVGHDNTL